MSDLDEWLKERRRIHELGNDVLLRNSYELERETGLGIRDAKAVEDGFNNLPALLTAVEKVLEQVEFMETDAENYLNAGHLHASEVLLENAGDLRQAIKGAINEQ